LGIVAVAAVNLLCLRSKLLVNQGDSAFAAQETGLMPVLLFVRQVFGVDSNQLITLIAGVGKDRFIAADAVGMVITEDITLARQGLVALPTAEVGRVPVLIHRLRVLSAKNQRGNWICLWIYRGQ